MYMRFAIPKFKIFVKLHIFLLQYAKFTLCILHFISLPKHFRRNCDNFFKNLLTNRYKCDNIFG